MYIPVKKNVDLQELRLIFYIQLLLIALLIILFVMGHYVRVIHVGSFFFCITMGGMGASVSLMKRVLDDNAMIKTSQEELRRFAVYIPVLYGVLMAGLTYLFFMSGLLSGDAIVATKETIHGTGIETNGEIRGHGLLRTNLFPNFSRPVDSPNLFHQFVHASPSSLQSMGKLLVWCFIAGYSERFVTGILEQLESKAE